MYSIQILDGLRMDTLDTVLRQHTLGNSSWAFEEGISTSTCFWKGDHVADRLRVAKYGHQPVEPCVDSASACSDQFLVESTPTERDSTMWRSATLEGMQKVVKSSLF